VHVIRAMGLVSISIAAVVSCTGHDVDSTSAPSPQVMPTIATQPLACNLVPVRSVTLMFSRIPYRIVVLEWPAKNSNGSFSSAKCRIIERSGHKDTLLDVTVSQGVDPVLVESAAEQRAKNLQYFPSDLGPGIAQIRPGVDLGGKDRKTASAALQWGDYTIYTVLNREDRGRDLLRDVIAVTQQVGSALNLPKKPTSPYPQPS
jgi:hypothetical protein